MVVPSVLTARSQQAMTAAKVAARIGKAAWIEPEQSSSACAGSRCADGHKIPWTQGVDLQSKANHVVQTHGMPDPNAGMLGQGWSSRQDLHLLGNTVGLSL